MLPNLVKTDSFFYAKSDVLHMGHLSAGNWYTLQALVLQALVHIKIAIYLSVGGQWRIFTSPLPTST